MGLHDARELSTRILREVQAGHDPAVEKRKRREEQAAAGPKPCRPSAEEFLRREGPGCAPLGQRRSDLELLYKPFGQRPIPRFDARNLSVNLIALRISAVRSGPIGCRRRPRRLLNWGSLAY